MVPLWGIMDKETLSMFARRVFDLAKADFENGDTDDIRAGNLDESLRLSK